MAQVIIGDTTVYAPGFLGHNAQSTPPPIPPGCYLNQESVFRLIPSGGTPIPGPAGTVYDVISINAYARVAVTVPPLVNVSLCLYRDVAGSPVLQVANSQATQSFNLNNAGTWVSLVYPLPRPQVIAGAAYWFGYNATSGAAGSSADISFNIAGISRQYEIKNDPAAAGAFSNPWGVYVPSGLGDFSAYIVIDVPNRMDLRPPEKYHRLLGRRGGRR